MGKNEPGPRAPESWERRCWEDLAIAIILQALMDYIALDDCIQTKYISYTKQLRKIDALRFLNSHWFDFLNPTGHTGEELIRFARQCKYSRSNLYDNWRNEQ